MGNLTSCCCLVSVTHRATWSVVNIIKYFTVVIYDSRVVWLENCPYFDSRVVIYACNMFIRLDTGKKKVYYIISHNIGCRTLFSIHTTTKNWQYNDWSTYICIDLYFLNSHSHTSGCQGVANAHGLFLLLPPGSLHHPVFQRNWVLSLPLLHFILNYIGLDFHDVLFKFNKLNVL